jgi:hypothetical protein
MLFREISLAKPWNRSLALPIGPERPDQLDKKKIRGDVDQLADLKMPWKIVQRAPVSCGCSGYSATTTVYVLFSKNDYQLELQCSPMSPHPC